VLQEALHSWLTFYFHYGLMYWRFRQAIQREDFQMVNSTWTWSTSLFIAANKSHYARLCIIATHILHSAAPDVSAILNKRFLSLSGKLGHSVAIDIGVEKINATTKDSVAHATVNRVDSFVSCMTLAKEVTGHLLDELCLEISGDRRPLAYKHDVEQIALILQETFGGSSEKLRQPAVFKDFHGRHCFPDLTPEKRLQEALQKLPKIVSHNRAELYALTQFEDPLDGNIPTDSLTCVDSGNQNESN
jgi:hypothetical protein